MSLTVSVQSHGLTGRQANLMDIITTLGHYIWINSKPFYAYYNNANQISFLRVLSHVFELNKSKC